jgi:hypothetical protein
MVVSTVFVIITVGAWAARTVWYDDAAGEAETGRHQARKNNKFLHSFLLYEFAGTLQVLHETIL